MTKKKHSMLAIVSCLLLLAMAIGFTSLYLTDNDTATNTVTVGDVKIDLLEPNWEDTNNVVPNQELPKDPQIKNTGINDAVVFMTVEVPVENITLAADDGTKGTKGNNELFWFKDAADGASVHANNFDSNWVHLDTRDVGANLTGATRTYVFAYKTPIAKDETTTALFDKIQVKNFIENEIPAGKTEQIKINAYGIQASDVLESGVDLTDTLSNANLDKIYGIFIKQAFNQDASTTPVVEHEDITYNVENADVQAFLATPAYDSGDYSYTNMPSSYTTSKPDTPNTATMTLPEGSATITFTDSASNETWTEQISGDTYTFKNFIPNRTYTYSVKNSSGTEVKSGSITPTGTLRMIDLESSTLGNVRDIGGWTANGGTIKYGKVFRGSRLEDASNETKTMLTDRLNIKSEIDLRGDSEVSSSESVLDGVSYIRVPISQGTAKPSSTTQSTAMKRIFTQIAFDLRNGKNLYIHCAAGADRTAAVFCILEGILGVSQSDIDKDYEISSYFASNRLRNITGNSTWQSLINDINTFCEGNTFEEKCIYYLQWIDVSDADINTIRQELINGSVSTVTKTETEMFDKNTATLNSRLGSSGSVSSYTPSEGKTLVTDWIPVSKYDIIEFHSDMAQSDNYGGYAQVYDGNKTRLYTASKTTTAVWEWNDSMTDGTFKLWNINRATNALNWDIQYMRFIVQYDDIDSVSIIKR